MNTKPLLSFIALGLAAGCVTSTPIPGSLDPGAGASLAMVLPASGVQIYECRRKADTDSFEWAFVAPEAELFDARGRQVGVHGAGPHWTAADGSRVTAKLIAKADAPDGAAIPWLLLEAKDAGQPGTFSRVTRIQRINTTGGMAPSKPCLGPLLGRQIGVHYTADYRFFVQLANTKVY